MPRLRVGINHPWHNYGFDFGPAPQPLDASVPFTPETWYSRTEPEPRSPDGKKMPPTPLQRSLQIYQDCGIEIVRWFILADGSNYGVPTWSNGTWHFQGQALHKSFMEHFRGLLAMFRATASTGNNKRIDLLPSIIDNKFLTAGRIVVKIIDSRSRELEVEARAPTVEEFVNRVVRAGKTALDRRQTWDYSKYIKGGRQDAINDPIQFELFLGQVVEPILAELAKNWTDCVKIVELINEPEIASPAPVSESKMQAFIRRGAGMIKAYGFQPTVGFQRHDTIDRWQLRDVLPFFQFHHYPEYGRKKALELPKGDGTASRPSCVGEFATAADHTGEHLAPWPELKDEPQFHVWERLRKLEEWNYQYAFLWSARAEDSVSAWTEYEQEQVRAFTSRRMPINIQRQ